MDLGTLEIAVLALLAKTATFAVAAVAMYVMMVLYDRASHVKTKQAFDKVESDPRAVADYFGWRIVAFAIVAGFVFS